MRLCFPLTEELIPLQPFEWTAPRQSRPVSPCLYSCVFSYTHPIRMDKTLCFLSGALLISNRLSHREDSLYSCHCGNLNDYRLFGKTQPLCIEQSLLPYGLP